VTPKMVKLDLNHPLAGKELFFRVTVVGLREPTEEEISHGHVHGEDFEDEEFEDEDLFEDEDEDEEVEEE